MLTWIIATLVFIALVAFPPSRSVLAWILDIPGKLLFQWAMFLVMRLFQAHFVVLKNLVMPRAAIFPTLKSDDRVRKD
jgi:hypothetical protein